MADSPDNNGRVTLAELRRDILHLVEMVRQERDETRQWREAVDGRLRYLETQCQDAKSELARLDERQKATTGALGVLIAVGSTIAAAVGSFVK